MTPKQDDGKERLLPREEENSYLDEESLYIQHSHLEGQDQWAQMQPLKGYLETSRSQIVEQMEDTGEQDVSPCLFPLTDSAAAQNTVTEDAFLDALQKQQMKLEDGNCLLAELVRIEQDLRERLRIQEERQRELERVRQEENRQRRRSLCFLILNQRTAKRSLGLRFGITIKRTRGEHEKLHTENNSSSGLNWQRSRRTTMPL